MNELDVFEALACADFVEFAVAVEKLRIFRGRCESATSENDYLLFINLNRRREAVESGVTAIMYSAAFIDGAAISAGAIGVAQSSMFFGYSHRLADTVVVFDATDGCAVACECNQRYVVFFSQRFLKTQPDSERAWILSLVVPHRGIAGSLFIQLIAEPLGSFLLQK